jgi:hypothetical protein
MNEDGRDGAHQDVRPHRHHGRRSRLVTAFFVGLGLEVESRTFVEGEFLDTVCGNPDSRTEIVMLRPPDGGTRLELSSFIRPDHVSGSPAAMANELGLRNVCFEVDDLPRIVNDLAAAGYGLVAGIGDFEDAWRMTYAREPEGVIVGPRRLGLRGRRRPVPSPGRRRHRAQGHSDKSAAVRQG